MYTPPAVDSVDFVMEAYTPLASDEVDFDLTPLTTDDTAFTNRSPFTQDESVGTCTATNGVEPYSWEIASQDLGSAFAIDASTGEITIETPGDCEAGQTWEVVVRVTDAIGQTDEATVTITLLSSGRRSAISIGIGIGLKI